MAIDIQNETTLPIRKVPAWCEEHLDKRVHISTVHRWRQRGARGVKLETILIGGNRFTSVEALSRFFAATTAVADGYDPAIQMPSGLVDRTQQQADSFMESEGA